MKKEQKNSSRLLWLDQEQKILKHLHDVQQIKSWKTIANYMNSIFKDRVRTPKQYRQRYTNFIKFQQFRSERGSWTPQQDQIIFDKYMELGSKWVQISKYINGRSQNQIKNRFYSSMRKLIRKINSALSNNKNQHKIKKKIKQSSIFKLLETNFKQKADGQPSNQQRNVFIFQLKYDCLNTANILQRVSSDLQLVNLGERIHKFNSITRFQNLKRSRNASSAKRKCFPPVINLGKSALKEEICYSQCEKQIYQTNESEKQSKQSSQILEAQAVSIDNFVKQEGVCSLQILRDEVTVRNVHKDLQQELSLILGVRYEPSQPLILF